MGTLNKPPFPYYKTSTVITIEPPKKGSGITIGNLITGFRIAAIDQNIEDVYIGEEIRNLHAEVISRNTIKNFKGPSGLYRIEEGNQPKKFIEELQIKPYSLADAIMRMTALVHMGTFAFKDDIPVTILLTSGKDGKPRALHVWRDTTISGVLNMELTENYDLEICWVNPKTLLMG
jgi:hypothetical protein